jgi:hypothetical protein
MNLSELADRRRPLGQSASQTAPTSKAQARRLYYISRVGNKGDNVNEPNKFNPEKAARAQDPESGKSMIVGPGGPPTDQPSPAQAQAMLRRVGVDSYKDIDLLPFEEYSSSPDAQRKQDYLPASRRNPDGPRRRYGDGSKRFGGFIYPQEIVQQARSLVKAAKKGDAQAQKQLMHLATHRARGTRIGAGRIQTDSKSPPHGELFLEKLDRALNDGLLE